MRIIKGDNTVDPRTQRAKDQYEGMVLDTIDGTAKFEIVNFNSAADIEIHFLGTNLILHKSQYQIFHSGISNPFISKREGATCPLYFEDPYRKWMGTEFHTNQGYRVKIIDYKGTKAVTIQFQDEYGYIMTTNLENIQKGQVFNPYHRNELGAYIGVGPFTNQSKKDVALYNKWKNMLQRALNTEKYLAAHNSITTAYDKCGIVDAWLCFNNFAIWYTTQLSVLNPNYSYEIDKDIKYFKYKVNTNRMKMYGPNYCVLMPHDLNVAITAIPRISDPSNAIFLANKYLSENAIVKETYDLIFEAINYYNPGYFNAN